jgi:hypothetical protein
MLGPETARPPLIGPWVSRPGWTVLLLASVATGTLGLLLSFTPLAWAAAGVLLGVSIMCAPAWGLLPIAVLAGTASELVRLQFPATEGLLGQGRIAVLLAMCALFYLLSRRLDVRIPLTTSLVWGVYGASIIATALVASGAGRDAGLMLSDVQREFSQTLAPLFVGLCAFAGGTGRLKSIRALALVTLLLELAAILYWVWAALGYDNSVAARLPILELFRAEAERRQIQPGRTPFPFVGNDPNSAAAVFAVLAAFSAAPLMASRRRGDLTLAAMVMLGCSAAVFATGSRMGILLLGSIGASYTLHARVLFGRHQRKAAAATVLVSLVSAGVVAGLLPEERSVTLQDPNLMARIAIWEDAVGELGTSPIYGLGLRHAAGARYGVGQSVHNEYLQRFVDGGVIGGVVFVSLIGIMTVMCLATTKRGAVDGSIAVGFFAAFAALLVSMFAVASWTAAPFLQVVSWLFFGALSATYAARSVASPAR